ncbi:hypothetical protein E2C01_073476 [Portunus trituberculatus]|uniref:Uncharacterized protein n=1 Tax=Portunus trituberculatus TaxID=210409 RepID=A0A5B7IBS9_PORTR|nr:hypothetical protein [Portunus trituberculatus]
MGVQGHGAGRSLRPTMTSVWVGSWKGRDGGVESGKVSAAPSWFGSAGLRRNNLEHPANHICGL